MALAILQLVEKTRDRYSFYIDTGSSPWWELVIGDSVSKQNNADFVDGATSRLPMKGPEPNSLKTGRHVAIPATLFDEDRRFIQLFR